VSIKELPILVHMPTLANDVLSTTQRMTIDRPKRFSIPLPELINCSSLRTYNKKKWQFLSVTWQYIITRIIKYAVVSGSSSLPGIHPCVHHQTSHLHLINRAACPKILVHPALITSILHQLYLLAALPTKK
jgi:hypothetical protein